jgi:hypothetical protein
VTTDRLHPEKWYGSNLLSGRRELLSRRRNPHRGNPDLEPKDSNFLESSVSGRRELLSRRRNPRRGNPALESKDSNFLESSVSGRRELNPGPLAPHASALAGLRHAPSTCPQGYFPKGQAGIIAAIGESDNQEEKDISTQRTPGGTKEKSFPSCTFVPFVVRFFL